MIQHELARAFIERADALNLPLTRRSWSILSPGATGGPSLVVAASCCYRFVWTFHAAFAKHDYSEAIHA